MVTWLILPFPVLNLYFQCIFVSDRHNKTALILIDVAGQYTEPLYNRNYQTVRIKRYGLKYKEKHMLDPM